MPNSPKRLAIYLPGLCGGGAERTVLNLAQGIAGQGYAVDLVLAQAEGPFLTQVPESIRLVELNAWHLRAWRTLASLPSLVRYLRREQPEALLSALNRANIVALWARRLAGVPMRLVVSQHNVLSFWAQPAANYGRLMLWLIRRFYPWADGIVAVSGPR